MFLRWVQSQNQIHIAAKRCVRCVNVRWTWPLARLGIPAPGAQSIRSDGDEIHKGAPLGGAQVWTAYAATPGRLASLARQGSGCREARERSSKISVWQYMMMNEQYQARCSGIKNLQSVCLFLKFKHLWSSTCPIGRQ